MGHKGLSKLQMGQENPNGTIVAADTIWRGPFAGLQDSRKTESIEEQIGIALKSSRKFAASLFAELSMPVTEFTPEQAPHVMEAGIKSVNTGVEDGSGSSGLKYAYPFGTTTINTINSYTFETGDEDGAEVGEYMVVKAFTITAVKGEAVMLSSEWFGRQVAPQAFTGGQTAPAVSELHASAGGLYIDDEGGSFGGSAIAAGNLLEMTLAVKTGRVPLFTADSGQLYFQGEYFNIDEFEATLEIKFIHDTVAIAEKADWRADAERLVRIEFTGEDYATPGATPTFTGGKKGIQIDFPGAYDEFSAVEHEDGKSIVNAKLSGGYNNADAVGLSILICNELAAIP